MSGDTDGDGFAASPAGMDCDDDDPRVHPGAPERCGDGVAQDCGADLPCSAVIDGDGDGSLSRNELSSWQAQHRGTRCRGR